MSTSQVLVGTYDELQARTYKLKPGSNASVHFKAIAKDYVVGHFDVIGNIKMNRIIYYPQDEEEEIQLLGDFKIRN